MFLKNSFSRDGVGDAVGVGVGVGRVCAGALEPAIRRTVKNNNPHRQSNLLSFRIFFPLVNKVYFETTSTTNEPGFTVRVGLPPGVAAAVSTYSAALRKIFLVFGSKAIVRALGCVLRAPASS